MKNLLLISNISSQNEMLIEYAAKFCKHYQCKLHILHIAEDTDPVLVSSPQYYKDFDIKFINDSSVKTVEQITKITTELLDGEFIQVKISAGNQNKILNSFINENFIDLIIVGNTDLNKESDFKGHKNILMNMINTPLIVVPEYELFKPILKFNFLTTHTQNDLDDIIKLVGYFPESKIELTHLLSKEADLIEKQRSDKWVSHVKNKADTKIEYELVISELKDHIDSENFAIIKRFDAFVFSSHKRNFWSRLFDPSTTLGFLTSLEIPAIIFKIENKTSKT